MRNKNINIFGELGNCNTKGLGTNAITGLKLLTVFAALGFWLLLFDSPALAGSLSKTFTNETGKDAYDLHIKYNREVTTVQTPKTFKDVKDGSTVDLSDGTVAAGGSVEVEATGKGDVKINKWWWTDKNHKRIGKEHVGCNASDGCTNSDSSKISDALDTLRGVVTLDAKTKNGQKVSFTLPADMRAGDTISGSVIQENVRSGDTLEGAVIDINGSQHNLRNGIFTFVVPAAMATVPIILKDRSGREIARQQIPINQTVPVNVPTQPVIPPRIGQTGQIVSIPLKSDGIADNTRVNFTPLGNPSNPQPAAINIPVVAKSPRETSVNIPTNTQTGAGTLTTEDNGVRSQSKFNVLSIKLSADKLQLQKNEQTELHVEITGMEGLIEDNYQVTLNLKNLSPSVVRFNSTSDNITTKVTPNSQGMATANETLTGINAGAFTIRGLVKAEADDTQCAKEYKVCMDKVETDKKEAIKKCRDAGGTVAAVAECIANVESESKKLEDACFKAFEECRKNK